MELRHLKYFLTLADELHYGNAAKKLFISQPPLSRLIKSLEDELGVRLFERNNKHVSLTSYGVYLTAESQKLFQHVSMIKNHLELMKSGTQGQIKIGYVAAIMHSILPELLSKLKSNYPQINSYLYELENTSQIDALKSGDIDIGFLRVPTNDKELVFEHIHDDPFLLIISSDHRLSGQKTTDLIQLKDDPLITFSKTCAPLRNVKNICKKAGYSPNIVHQTNQINSILRLVESNMGYSIIPSAVIKGYSLKVRSYDLSAYNEYTPLFAGYNRTNLTEAVQNFIEVIRKS